MLSSGLGGRLGRIESKADVATVDAGVAVCNECAAPPVSDAEARYAAYVARASSRHPLYVTTSSLIGVVPAG